MIDRHQYIIVLSSILKEGEIYSYSDMARLDTMLDEKIDTRFRDTVYRTYGMRYGNLKRALEKAMTLLKTARDRKESAKK
jgi:hypothetical protein